jgi:hypothetical protein
MTALTLLLAAATLGADTDPTWKSTADSLALLRGEAVAWQFHYPNDRKPYFHPLTIAGAPVLTDFRPADHPWHRALWFSWKSIDGVLYWDEDPKTAASPGITEVVSSKVTPRADHSAHVELELAYHPPGRPAVLKEQRTVDVSPPGKSSDYHIDWKSTFIAVDSDVVLDRTPITGEPQGVSYGGYAGLSLRLNPALKALGWQFSDRDGPVKAVSKASPWMAFSGPTGNGNSNRAAIVVLEHPTSFRHPTPWYLIPDMPYFSPAVLYRAPYTLPAGKTLTLWYRILVHAGPVDRDATEAEWQAFAKMR